MDALLLALMVGLALDQGDRSQRLAANGRLLPVLVIVGVSAALAAILGHAIAPHLKGRAGLLFFSFALVLGAAGLLMPARSRDSVPPSSPELHIRMLVYRLADGSFFLLVAVAAMTGQSWTTAVGGALGGAAALTPPVLTGSGYAQAVPLHIIRPLLGALLLIAGLVCVVSALGLV